MLSPSSTCPALPDFAYVWRACELGSSKLPGVDTGYAALNQALPGGGWPQGALVEVLQPQAGLHEWGLLAPALAAMQRAAPSSLSDTSIQKSVRFWTCLKNRHFGLDFHGFAPFSWHFLPLSNF